MVFDNLDGLKDICDEAKIHSDISVQVNEEQVFNICFFLIQTLCKDPEYLDSSVEAFKAKQIITILREMSDKSGENWVCHKIIKIHNLVWKSKKDSNKGITKPNKSAFDRAVASLEGLDYVHKYVGTTSKPALVLKSEEDFNKGTTKPNLDIKSEEDFNKSANWYLLQRQIWDQCSPYWSKEEKKEFMKKIGLEGMPFPSN